MPAGFSAGDFGLLVHESSSTQPIAAPSGWVQMSGSPVDALVGPNVGEPCLQLFSRILQAGDAAPTLADSGNHNAAQIFAWAGEDSANPFSGSPSSSTAAASTSVSQPGVTTADPTTLVIYVVGHAIDSNLAQLSAQADASLSAIAERGDFATNANQGGGFAVTEGQLAAAGASGTMTATLAASSKQCLYAFALRAPSAAVPVPAPRIFYPQAVMSRAAW